MGHRDKKSRRAMIILYGIPHCDTVKKSRAWLAGHGVDAEFRDVRPGTFGGGLSAAQLQSWMTQLGWEPLVNRKGTTWRRLDEPVRAGVVDADSAVALLLAQPSVMKRPVVAWLDGSVTVGFDEAVFARQSALRP